MTSTMPAAESLLASFLSPADWEPLREVAAKLADARAEQAKIRQGLEDVDGAIFAAQVRAPLRAQAMADEVLAGKIPDAQQQPERQGLAGLPLAQLQGIRDELRRRAVQAKDEVAFYANRVRVLSRELVTAAARAASAEYVERARGLAQLIVELDAAQQLTDGRGTDQIVPADWRSTARIPAPALCDPKVRTVGGWGGSPVLLHSFDDGGRVKPAIDAWKAAVREATGIEIES